MSINHRRLDVAMAQEFLDRSDIITTFEQVSGEGVPERVAGGPLRQSSLCDRVLHGFFESAIHQCDGGLVPWFGGSSTGFPGEKSTASAIRSKRWDTCGLRRQA